MILHILAITAPIFVLIALGYACTRYGVFSKSDMRVLGKYVISLALPALIFRAMSQRNLAEIFNTTYLLAYLLGSLAALGLAYGIAKRVLRLRHTTASFAAMGSSCSNNGFVGYPILLMALPGTADLALSLNMVVENLVVIPLLVAMVGKTHAGSTPVRRAILLALGRFFRNPLVIGMLGGVAVSAAGRVLPSVVVRTIDMLAMSSGAVALLVIGGTLVGLPLRGIAWKVLPLSLAKLVLHPALVALACAVLVALGTPAIPAPLRAAAILSGAMPMLSIFPTLAQAHGEDDWSAVALVLTTILAFLTLSVWLWLLIGSV